jgi:hypothetical protein
MSSPTARINLLAGEPFRLPFPLGILASLIGVLRWPTFFASWIETCPLEAHARWMVIGFLDTAGQRLLGF